MDTIQTLKDYEAIWEKASEIAYALHLSKVKKGINTYISTIEFPDADSIKDDSTFRVEWEETWRYGGRCTESANIPFRYIIADDWKAEYEADQEAA